jgi:hypothetical protein
LNPLEWLKLAYETFGAKYPAGSMIAVMLLGAFVFGAVWQITAHKYQKDQIGDRQAPAVTTQQTGAAKTSGSNSPAITGSGNEISYGTADSEKTDKTKRKKQ